MDELRMFKQFISSAEHVWTQIASSPIGKTVYTVNGVDYTPLPEKYNSKRKISRIFRRYWGKQLTEAMIRNLQLRSLKGKLCVPSGVIPPFPTTVQSVQVRASLPNQRVVQAILIGKGKRITVDYRLIKTGNATSFTIMKRSGRQLDQRYRPARPVAAAPKPFINPKAAPHAKPRGKKKLLKTP
ncbi:DL-endopeptidase inhibitor IseA family protein [uncultured Brevibacillus sp.]|uniref:DL-endopeptidase inhibitor IseA family protein n=1 Tax=uncultured Brevibacillus sp. TaxID=169970 RepID=UPI0025947601|nr:DL-endopeptidase inhibitor IseA family protein [uncultured Brevibacillus sp.]